MAKNNIFKEDDATKQMLREISSLCGYKSDVVKTVWQYTIISIMLRVAEADETKLTRFNIPYIGNVCIKKNGTIATPNGIEPDLEPWLFLSDTFKSLLTNCQGGNYGDLASFIQKDFIEPVLENINQQ